MTSTITETSKKNKAEDVLLIRTIKTGTKRESDKAFEILFNKYYKPVLFNVSSKLNNSLDAEDVVLEMFAKLHTKLENYDETAAAFNTWLFTIAQNSFIDFLRKRKLETTGYDTQKDEDGNSNTREFPDTNTLSPDQVLIKKEKDALLDHLIDVSFKHKPNLKKLIKLRYFDELSYDEMSTLTELPLGTVKAQLHRAKKLLQQPCEKHGLKLK